MAVMSVTKHKNFCYAPWSSIEILPSGSILPCCKFSDQHYEQRYNITTHSIEDFRNSAKLKEIKQQFANGEWPRGCERCQIEEQSNIESRRQLDYQRWQQHYDNYDLDSDQLLTVGIALGNVCNLKCIICGPVSSSRWQQEYKDIYNKKIPIIEDVRRGFIGSITNYAPNLIHLDIHGGEPFLSGRNEHRALLDHYIDTGQAKNISIHYTTNGTIWPDDLFARWQHFKEIDLQLSIDGIRDRFEYLRFPAQWKVFVDNVQQYMIHQQQTSNFRLSVAYTVSAFNVYYLDEFVKWCKTIGLPKPWMGKLHNPPYLRPGAWHTVAKQYIIDKLNSSSDPDVHNWANLLLVSNDSDQFREFQKYVETHDQYRGLSYREKFPEMGQFL